MYILNEKIIAVGEIRAPMKQRARLAQHGMPSFAVKRRWFETRDERALVCQWVSDLKPFGAAYCDLQPEGVVAPRSGVLACPFIPTNRIVTDATYPGDIDLLLIPYESDDLILSRVMAIEAKAVRASYARQGKSPNEFGYSQASALLDLGFPYVALVHLVTSDISPREAWRKTGVARVLENDEVELLPDIDADLLPVDLLRRSFGRLVANCVNQEIGLVAAYVNDRLSGRPAGEFWLPYCRRALPNVKFDPVVAASISMFYERFSHRFLQIRSHTDH